MFRTWVQIWFQLEFPCNVPNLIKLMRGFFSSNSTGFPVSVPTSSAQPRTQEARASVGNERSCSIPATPFAVTADRPELTRSHARPPPSCLAFLCSPVFSVFWYGQKFGFRNWSQESCTNKERKIKQEFCVLPSLGSAH